jgi:hypothetical protein
MIRKTGAKWGVDGLQYPIHESDGQGSPLLITLDLTDNIEEILMFCGLDFKTWEKGFETQKEIFEFACQSPFFDKRIFLIENLNHTHRKRDQTRPDYHQWLDFIKDQQNKTLWSIKPSHTIKGNNSIEKDIQKQKNEFLVLLNDLFPNANLIERQNLERTASREFKYLKKEKFNGLLINQWTGLENEKLGYTIKKFKTYQNITNDKAFIKWLKSNSKEECQKIFLDFYTKLIDNSLTP